MNTVQTLLICLPREYEQAARQQRHRQYRLIKRACICLRKHREGYMAAGASLHACAASRHTCQSLHLCCRTACA